MNAALTVVGNPSSLHADGRAARKGVEDARDDIAKAIGCAPSEIVFTASGTEANNTAIKGLYWYRNTDSKRPVIIVSSIEHQAVLEPAQWLADHEGAEVVALDVDANGIINLEQLRKLVETRSAEIALISMMHSNNETGALQPIAEVVQIAGDIPVHSDAIQSFTKVPVSFKDLGLFALSLSGHKVGGPIGVGALVLKRGIDIPALIHGGGQEREIRSGTVNAPSIIAFAAAVKSSNYDAEKIAALRNRFEDEILKSLPDVTINAKSVKRLPGISNITFPQASNETMLLLLDGEKISCSTGAACTAGVHRPSHVLEAMGIEDSLVMNTLRFSFGATSTDSDVDAALAALPSVVERARKAGKA